MKQEQKKLSCTVGGCSKELVARGYCALHYKQIKSHGRITSVSSANDRRYAILKDGTAYIPLGVDAKDGYALVDEADTYIDKYFWNKSSHGYAVARINKVTVPMHRLLLRASKGSEIDHINLNPLDNRKSNLRFCTHSENMMNTKKRRTNTTGYKGVYRMRDRYQAKIKSGNVMYHIGTFTSILDAAKAYDMKALELNGEFSRLNNV